MSQITFETPTSVQPLGKMTYEQFLSWDSENQHVEWVNGKVIAMPPISDGHQDVSGFLLILLRTFVETNKLG